MAIGYLLFFAMGIYEFIQKSNYISVNIVRNVLHTKAVWKVMFGTIIQMRPTGPMDSNKWDTQIVNSIRHMKTV